MNILFYFGILFIGKVLDNALSTAKTILVQNNKCFLAGIALALSNFIYFVITKDIVGSDSILSIIIVSIASGVGCCLAMFFNDKFSKDRTYVNVIMSDDKASMIELRDFLAEHKITNIVADSYDRDWRKTLSITAYAETKEQSRLLDSFLENHNMKFKRFVEGNRVKN
jgi:uncharacterized protein YebE (UPF0316 family)